MTATAGFGEPQRAFCPTEGRYRPGLHLAPHARAWPGLIRQAEDQRRGGLAEECDEEKGASAATGMPST